jgi:selenocysteine lyase/cysteine desulfurase
MLKSQFFKFKLPKDISYLNCAYMSPLLKEVARTGKQSVDKKCLPYRITGADFFNQTNDLKKKFARLVSVTDFQNIAIIPSVSYAIASVANSIELQKGSEILVVGEQFPSNIYSWQKVALQKEAVITVSKSPKIEKGRGLKWNKDLLSKINSKTKIVAVPQVHWSDGTLFDLPAIRKKANDVGAYLVVDGTQSVGAMPFSVKEIQPDALICAGYKWLFGPYSIGLAYFSDELCQIGKPIEENWINRKKSENFADLVNYEPNYQPKAGKFNVGEMSNFILTPMLLKAIEQLIDWQPERIQKYTKEISNKAIEKLQNLGCFIEDEQFRGSHLFGVYLPENTKVERLKKVLKDNKVYVSFRGSAVRISSHLYNTKTDFDKLIFCFEQVLQK